MKLPMMPTVIFQACSSKKNRRPKTENAVWFVFIKNNISMLMHKFSFSSIGKRIPAFPDSSDPPSSVGTPAGGRSNLPGRQYNRAPRCTCFDPARRPIIPRQIGRSRRISSSLCFILIPLTADLFAPDAVPAQFPRHCTRIPRHAFRFLSVTEPLCVIFP